jgi:hypothetical protein
VTAKKQNVSELVEETFVSSTPSRCWARRLTGQAKEYIEALEERAQKGTRPVHAKVSRILEQHFSVKIGSSAVAKHFGGGCACPSI